MGWVKTVLLLLLSPISLLRHAGALGRLRLWLADGKAKTSRNCAPGYVTNQPGGWLNSDHAGR